MSQLDDLAGRVATAIVGPRVNVTPEALEAAIEPNIDLDEAFYGEASGMYCENTTVKDVEHLDAPGSFVLKAVVDTEPHDDLPVRFTEHILAITSRDLGIVHPDALVGKTIPLTYSETRGNRIFEAGDASVCTQHLYSKEKRLVDAKHVYDYRSKQFRSGDDDAEISG